MGCVLSGTNEEDEEDEEEYSTSSMEELPMIELIKTKEMLYVENIQKLFREEYIKKKIIYNI